MCFYFSICFSDPLGIYPDVCLQEFCHFPHGYPVSLILSHIIFYRSFFLFAPFKLLEFPKVSVLLFTANFVGFNLLLHSMLLTTVCHLLVFISFSSYYLSSSFPAQPFSLFNILLFLGDHIFSYFLRMPNS